MSTDLLRTQPNERVDYTDFSYMLDESMTGIMRDAGNNFFLNPDGAAADRMCIIDGFEMSNPSAKQLTVTRGRAMLAERVAGNVEYGVLASKGESTQTIDMGPLASATYGVYIRFEYVDGASGSRVFWNPSGAGSEFTQNISTRRQANWSIRVELASPGAEWLQIGTANNAGGSLVLVDLRDLYFEGPVASSYESGWSAEGGGVANDRNADRQQYGVKDLRTFTDAMRQCLEDIRGRGLRRWYEKGIGGINVGFDTDPTENRINVGDANFGLARIDANDVRLYGNADDHLRFDRDEDTHGAWEFFINNAEEVRISSSGVAITNGLYIGSIAGTPSDNDILCEGGINCGGTTLPLNGDAIIERGMVVGFDAAPSEDEIRIGDADFRLDWVSANEVNIWFDASDRILFDRDGGDGSVGRWIWSINGVSELDFDRKGMRIENGLYVGSSTGTPTDNDIYAVGDLICGNFVAAGGRRFVFGAETDNDWIDYDDTAKEMDFGIDGSIELRVANDGVNIANGLMVGDLSTAPVDNEIISSGRIRAGGDLYAGSGSVVFGVLGSDDYINYAANEYNFYINNTSEVKMSASGINVLNGVHIGSLTQTPSDDDLTVDGTIETGSDIAAGSRIFRFGLLSSNDYLAYNDTNDDLDFVMDGVTEYRFDKTGLDMNGNTIFDCGTIACGAVTSTGIVQGTRFQIDSNDYLDWVSNQYAQIFVNGAEEMRVTTTGVAITNGLYVGAIDQTPVDNVITAQGDIFSGNKFARGSDTGRYLFFTTISGDEEYAYLGVDGGPELRCQAGAGVDDGVVIYSGLVVGDSTPPSGRPSFPDIWCAGDIIANINGTGHMYTSALSVGYFGGSPDEPLTGNAFFESMVGIGYDNAAAQTDNSLQIRPDGAAVAQAVLSHDGSDGKLYYAGSSSATGASVEHDASWAEIMIGNGILTPIHFWFSDRYGCRSSYGFHRGGEHLTANMLGERDGTDWVWAHNSSGVTINKGELVEISGNSTTRIEVQRLATSDRAMFGVAIANITSGSRGRVAVGGLVKCRWGTAVYTQYGYFARSGQGGTTYYTGTATTRDDQTFGVYLGGPVDTNYGWVYITH